MDTKHFLGTNEAPQVLIVEDNPVDAKLLTVLLQEHLTGASIQHATRLRNGLKMIESQKPDLVFLDMSLPDTHDRGLEGLRKLKQHHPDVLVIVLTGNRNPEFAIEALELGAQDYLNKDELNKYTLMRVIRFAFYRNQSERELKQALERANDSNKAKSRFLANITHEMKTPLNAVIGISSFLKDDLSALSGSPFDQYASHLEIVEESGNQLLDLIENILELSQLETGHVKIERQPFNLRQVLQKSLHSMEGKASRQGNRISLSADKSLPALINGDAYRIQQILSQVVGNAIKFTQNGSISVHASSEPVEHSPSQVQINIQVSDTGIGIAPEQQTRIFERFTQADESNTRAHSGAGIGLTICRKLCEMMSGDIWVESKLGEGSCFTFELIMDRVLPSVESTPERPPAEQTVLIIDDDPTSQKILSHQVSKLGFAIRFANDSQEAKKILDDSSVNYVMLDVHLAEKSGIDLWKEIKHQESAPNAVPIAITSDCSEETKNACSEAGIRNLLLKPIPDNDLEGLFGSRSKLANTKLTQNR